MDSRCTWLQANTHCTRARKASNLIFANKTRVYHFPETWLSGLLANCQQYSQQSESAIPPLLYNPGMLSSISDKAKLFAENFSNNSNLRMHTSVTPKVVKQQWTLLCQRCLVLTVFQYWFLSEPELSHILAELFNMCLKESCFEIVRKSHQWSLRLRMLGAGLPLKTSTLLVFFPQLVKSLKSL